MASILIIPAALTVATSWLYYLTTIAPKRSGDSMDRLYFPSNLDDLRTISFVFHDYKQENFSYVVILFVSAYLYKQTFAIPGSVFMNILAGALFGLFHGFILTCVLTACGATFCYLLSKLCGKAYVEKYLQTKLSILQQKVSDNRGNLFYYLLFIRLFPMTPNWFINMSSPILNIPIHLFFLSVLIGLMPYNLLCVQTGVMLTNISSIDDIFTTKTLFGLLGLSLIALIPAIVKKIIQRRKRT
ncbi:TMEM41A (predicted) [Pycnogonum litorale]